MRMRALPATLLVTLLLLGAGCKKTQTAEQSTNPQTAAPTDQQIANDIQTKLNGEGALTGQNIQVAVVNGVATLSGAANDDASRALAGNDAGSVSGVKTVVNNLTVQPVKAAAPPPAPAPAPVKESRKERKRHQREEQVAQNTPPPPAAGPEPPQPVQQAAPAPPPPPPAPVAKTVTIPAGTVVPVRLTDALDSQRTQTGQTFRGSVAGDLIAEGMVAVPQGASVVGRVVDAKDAAHFKGSALISIELTQINAHGRQIAVVTDTFTKEGAGRGKNTAAKAGGGAAIGAIIGALAGGGKGAAIGAVTGGGVGAGVNAVTRGQQVQIPSETLVNFRLQSPITVTTSRAVGAPRVFGNDQPALEQRQPQ